MQHLHLKVISCLLIVFTCLLSTLPLCSSLPLLYPSLYDSSDPSHELSNSIDSEKQEATNYFIDNIIEAFHSSWSSKLDPLHITKLQLTFTKDFLGDALIKNITVTGLSKVKRSQNASIGSEDASGLLFADASVSIEKLHVTCYSEIKFLGLSIASDVIINIDYIEVNIKGYLGNDSGKPYIDSLSVTHLHGVNIDIKSFGAAGSKMIDIVTSIIITVFKGSIKRIIEENLLKFAYEAIYKYNLHLN